MEDNKFSKLTASAIPDSDALMEDSREAEIQALKNRIEVLEKAFREIKAVFLSTPTLRVESKVWQIIDAALQVKP